VPPGESFINLSIQSDLFISNDSRQDLPNGNLFLRSVKIASFKLLLDFQTTVLRAFLNLSTDRLIYQCPQLSQPEAEVALWLYSVLAYQFRTANSYFFGEVKPL